MHLADLWRSLRRRATNFVGKSRAYDYNMTFAEEVGFGLLAEVKFDDTDQLLRMIERIDREVIPLTFKFDQGTQRAEIMTVLRQRTPEALMSATREPACCS